MCDTFEKVGPDAPTLCEGWDTLDLAAHLVAREARSDAALGLVVPFLAGHLQNVMDKYKAKGYEPLVAMLRTGPPWMHRTGPLATANVNENFVHHEDVRRPAGEAPRPLEPEMDADPVEDARVRLQQEVDPGRRARRCARRAAARRPSPRRARRSR